MIEERHRFRILIVTDCILFGKWKEKPMPLTKPSVIFDDRRASYMYVYEREFIAAFHGEDLRQLLKCLWVTISRDILQEIIFILIVTRRGFRRIRGLAFTPAFVCTFPSASQWSFAFPSNVIRSVVLRSGENWRGVISHVWPQSWAMEIRDALEVEQHVWH